MLIVEVQPSVTDHLHVAVSSVVNDDVKAPPRLIDPLVKGLGIALVSHQGLLIGDESHVDKLNIISGEKSKDCHRNHSHIIFLPC